MSALHCLTGQHRTCTLFSNERKHIACRAKDLQEQRKAEAYVRRMAALGVPVPVPDRLAIQQQQAPARWQQAPASYEGVDVGSDAYQRQHMQGPPSTSGRPTYRASNEALHWELPQVQGPGLSFWCLQATTCGLHQKACCCGSVLAGSCSVQTQCSWASHPCSSPSWLADHFVLYCGGAVHAPKQQSPRTAAGLEGG